VLVDAWCGGQVRTQLRTQPLHEPVTHSQNDENVSRGLTGKWRLLGPAQPGKPWRMLANTSELRFRGVRHTFFTWGDAGAGTCSGCSERGRAGGVGLPGACGGNDASWPGAVVADGPDCPAPGKGRMIGGSEARPDEAGGHVSGHRGSTCPPPT
jgi:hypothetical protein